MEVSVLLTGAHDAGMIIRRRRHELSMSQSDLAQRAGITRQLLSRFEQGKSDLPMSTALRVMRELTLSIDVRSREERRSTLELRIPLIRPATVTLPRLDANTLRAIHAAVEQAQQSQLHAANSRPPDTARER